MTDGIVNDTTEPAEQELMVPQSKVNEVVGREKQAVERRVKAELEAKHMAELEALKQQQGQGVDTEAIAKQAAAQAKEEMRREMEEERLEQQKAQYVQYLDGVAGNYVEKMRAGPSLYEDFQEVIADFDPKEFKDLLFVAHDMPELPDLIYELAQNGDKLDRLDSLARKSPKMAKKEIQKLADSIKANKQAKDTHSPTNPPLKSLKPSTAAGVGDGGKMGLKDLKKASWLRG